ncbi:MAG: superoxide dismutase family protein [Candidatus Omnitrophica bacterium]|nr:superoxide dismutase family protein [Candidatus Omnitrophota bacterium]
MRIACAAVVLSGSLAGMAFAGVVELKATREGSPVKGTVRLEAVEEGLKITAQVEGVPPGRHGFHIHENGSCADEGKAAGGHFNPDNVPHGFPVKDGVSHAHAGDMGNLEAGRDGRGALEITLPHLSFAPGRYGVVGRAVILHEKEDDFSQPTGNAGGRIGCGVISAD